MGRGRGDKQRLISVREFSFQEPTKGSAKRASALGIRGVGFLERDLHDSTEVFAQTAYRRAYV